VVPHSQPLFPPVEIIYRHAGSIYNCEMTPVRWPGMMRKGTVEWREVCSAWRSYRRRISFEALEEKESTQQMNKRKEGPQDGWQVVFDEELTRQDVVHLALP
jgi:hypothetical protein